MIQIDDVVISLDVFREKFLCNLDACKGECCIEGGCRRTGRTGGSGKTGRGASCYLGRTFARGTGGD